MFTWRPLTFDVFRPKLAEKVESHLLEIIGVFGTETAVALELMTHNERPWVEARDGLAASAVGTNAISKVSMRDYYRELGGQG